MPFIWNASSCLCWALSFPKDKSPSKKLLTSGLHQQLGHKLFHVFKSPEQNRAADFSSSAVGWNELRELLTSKHRQHLHLVQKADVHFTPSFSPVSIELNYTNYLEHLKELKPQNETSQKTSIKIQLCMDQFCFLNLLQSQTHCSKSVEKNASVFIPHPGLAVHLQFQWLNFTLNSHFLCSLYHHL